MVATVGAVLGDHVPYWAGRLAGTRILAVYCRITLASDRCVERTLVYFARFGAAALLFSRFSTSVRLFASACAGCAHLTYVRYLVLDAVGTVRYTTLWVVVGAFIGERAVIFFTTDRRRWLFLGLVALAAGTLLGMTTQRFQIWRRTGCKCDWYRYTAPRSISIRREVTIAQCGAGLAARRLTGRNARACRRARGMTVLMVSLPLVLAGPILRRVEPNLVAIWLALSRPASVTITLWEGRVKAGAVDHLFRSDPASPTLRLADRLHVTCALLRYPGRTFSVRHTSSSLFVLP